MFPAGTKASTPRPKGALRLSSMSLEVDYAGHVVLVKCYSGMANAACEVFDALQWKNVVGTLSGDDTFLIVARSERDAKTICSELTRYVGQR